MTMAFIRGKEFQASIRHLLLLLALMAIQGTAYTATDRTYTNSTIKEFLNQVYAINCDRDSPMFLMREGANGNIYLYTSDSFKQPVSPELIYILESYGSEEEPGALVTTHGYGNDKSSWINRHSWFKVSLAEKYASGRVTLRLVTQWTGVDIRGSSDKKNFEIVDGKFLSTGAKFPTYTQCAYDSPATIGMVKQIEPNRNYLADIESARRETEASRRRFEAQRQDMEAKRKQCEGRVSYYLQQCRTAGDIDRCVEISSQGKVFKRSGQSLQDSWLSGTSNGWNCQ